MTEENSIPEKGIILSWKSSSRPFKKRDRDFFTTIGAMAFLISVILFFMKEWLLIGAVLALVFMVYCLSTIPPEEVEHTITDNSLRSAGHTYKWTELKEFWFGQKWGYDILYIQTKLRFPPRIILLFDKQMKEEIKKALSPYLLYRESPEKNFLDKAAEWLSQKITLEKSPS